MTAAELGERVQQLVATATAQLKSDGVPGVQIGLIQGDLETVVALGTADVRTGRGVSDQTLFRIGSITKTFTATALVQLAQQGRLALDHPVRAYVPEFALGEQGAADRVTIRHLLLHTGGWQPYLERVAAGPNALAEGARGQVHATPFAMPGTLFSYNGVGYMIAGRVVEVATGQAYEDAIRSMLLVPLGMARTKFATESDEDVAADHTVRDGRAQTLEPYDEGGRWPLPSGGLRSTARDMLRWARCHMGETSVLDAAALAFMAERQASAPDPREAKALSWFVRDLGTERLLIHLGGPPGQQALLALCPRRRFALVVHTNSAVGSGLLSALLARALDLCLGIQEPPAPEPLVLGPAALDEYEGTYTNVEADLVLSCADDALALEVINKGPYADRPRLPCALLRFWERDRVVGSDGWAKGRYGDFVRDELGRVAYFRWGARAMKRVRAGDAQGGDGL